MNEKLVKDSLDSIRAALDDVPGLSLVLDWVIAEYEREIRACGTQIVMSGPVHIPTVFGPPILVPPVADELDALEAKVDPHFTEITPTTEEGARAVAVHNQPEPVHSWELPSRRELPCDDFGEDD